jgi:hypothetical protein
MRVPAGVHSTMFRLVLRGMIRFLLRLMPIEWLHASRARTTTERDSALRSRFNTVDRIFLRRLNVYMPNGDNANKIKVVAVMPTASLETRLEGGNKKDACVLFCVVDWSIHDKQQFLHAQNVQWFAKTQMKVFFTFAAITKRVYYDRFLVFHASECFRRLPPDLIRLIAEHYADYYTTYFMAVWMGRGKRRRWMQIGLNTPSDNDMDMFETMNKWYMLSDDHVQKLLAARA